MANSLHLWKKVDWTQNQGLQVSQPDLRPQKSILKKGQGQQLAPVTQQCSYRKGGTLTLTNWNTKGLTYDKWTFLKQTFQSDVYFLQETYGFLDKQKPNPHLLNHHVFYKTRDDNSSLAILVHKRWNAVRFEDETIDAVGAKIFLNNGHFIILINLHQLKNFEQYNYYMNKYANNLIIIGGDMNRDIANPGLRKVKQKIKDIQKKIQLGTIQKQLDTQFIRLQDAKDIMVDIISSNNNKNMSSAKYKTLIDQQSIKIEKINNKIEKLKTSIQEEPLVLQQKQQELLKLLNSKKNIPLNSHYSLLTGTSTRRMKNKGKSSILDFLIIHKTLKDYEFKLEPFNDKSDHRILNLEVKLSQNQSLTQPVINKRAFTKKFINAKGIIKDPSFNTIHNYIHYCNSQEYKEDIVRIKQYPPIDYQTSTKLMKPKLFSKDNKQFHDFISHTKDLKPDKRDGAIVSCFQRDNEIIAGYKNVMNEAINFLSNIQQTADPPVNPNISLPLLENEDYIDLLNLIGSSKKAVSFDGIDGPTLKKIILQTGNFLNLWDTKLLEQLKYSMEMRLIPLNKVFPKIPSPDEYRPIIVLSHLVKLIESRFIKKFQQIVLELIRPSQTGFIPGIGTQINILTVQEFIKMTGINNKALMFIDLKNAYNTVIREELFKHLKLPKFRKYISLDEIQFLEWLYNYISIYNPYSKENIRWKNGVHQGSLLSPFLFDIYMDGIMTQLENQLEKNNFIQYKDYSNIVEYLIPYKKRIINDQVVRIAQKKQIFRYLLYADDLVILTQQHMCNEILDQMEYVFSERNLKINFKKTVIMSRNQFELKEIYQEIKIQQEFCYLGVYLKITGSLLTQFVYIKKKIQYLIYQLSPLNKLLPIRHMAQLWNCYIKPHFDYSKTLIANARPSVQKKWEQLRIFSIKRLLKFNIRTPSSEINWLFGTFNWESQSLQNQLQNQQARFWRPEKNYIKPPLEEYYIIREFQIKRYHKCLIKLIPSCWRNKYSMYGQKCEKCSFLNKEETRWSLNHLLIHNDNTKELANKFLKLEIEIKEIAETFHYYTEYYKKNPIGRQLIRRIRYKIYNWTRKINIEVSKCSIPPQ